MGNKRKGNDFAAVVALATTYTRRYQEHEAEAAVGLWAEAFADVGAVELRKAVVAWASGIREDQRRSQQLPTIQDLRAIMAKGNVPEKKPRTEFRRPSNEFRERHTAATRRLQALLGSSVGFSLEDSQRRSTALSESRAEGRREQLQAVLDELPPATEGSPRPCRCDGSGMVDDKATVEALAAKDFDAPRAVYPCPRCNLELFNRWNSGQL